MKWVVFLTPLAVALAGCSGDEDPQAPIPDDVVADALEQAFDLVGATPEQEAAIRANVDVDQDPDDGSKLGERSGTTIVLYSDAIQALVQPPNVPTLTGCLGVILAHEIMHLDPGICGGVTGSGVPGESPTGGPTCAHVGLQLWTCTQLCDKAASDPSYCDAARGICQVLKSVEFKAAARRCMQEGWSKAPGPAGGWGFDRPWDTRCTPCAF